MAVFFDNITSNLFALLAILIGLGYYLVTWKFNYWQRKGVKFLKPSFPFGNLTDAFLQKLSLGEHLAVLHAKTTEPFIGMYNMLGPAIIIRDPELLRALLIKDFNSFKDRGTHSDESYDPLSGHLFVVGGEKWKTLRAKLTPTFTTGKLKSMFSTLVDCSHALDKYVEQSADAGRTIELRELYAQYSTNIIASAAFGIDIDSIGHPDVPFRKIGRKVFAPTMKNALRFLVQFFFPKFMYMLKIKSVDQDVEDFMMSVVRQNMEHREKNNISRKDFFQLLVQLRNTGDVQVDGLWDTKIVKDESSKKLTIGECAAQTFVFFLAGFETTSATMSFALYELAKNETIQRKAQQEIDEVLHRHGGQITYESINDMKYLESVIDESLRKYPPVPFLNRECNTPWTIPNTNIVLEKGTPVIVSLVGLHNDPKHYPEPDKFIPERFSAENKRNIYERPYFPFGEGPRNCIGMRMGQMESKIGLVTMLQKYSYTLTGESLKPMLFNSRSIFLAPKKGIFLNVTKR